MCNTAPRQEGGAQGNPSGPGTVPLQGARARARSKCSPLDIGQCVTALLGPGWWLVAWGLWPHHTCRSCASSDWFSL